MIAALLSYLLLYKYVAIFILVFSAAVILPLPVNSILLAVGAFASQGYFSFWLSLAVAMAANMLGDLFGYWLTRTYGEAVIKSFYAKRHEVLVRLEKYIQSRAGLTIFLTRFTGISDIAGNFLAGIVGVPLRTFIIFDFLGNFCVFFPVLSLGYIAGNYWQDYSNVIDVASGIFLVLIILFMITRTIYHRSKKRRGLGI